MGKFDGKVVLITGGARGQGRSHAIRFAEEGADIAVCDLAGPVDTVTYPMPGHDDLTETVRLVEELDRRCLSEVLDVRDADALAGFAERVCREYGRIDILLANAGIFTFSTVAEMDVATWRETLDINLTGVFNAVRATLPTMIAQQYGRIVVTSSMAGKCGYAHLAHYSAAKWGLIGLVKSLAIEVGGVGITVNAVCPTSVDTTMIHNPDAYRLFLPDMPDATRTDVEPAFRSLNHIPVPWVEPRDVSNAMAFLCSDDARYITGETLAVAAGQNAGNAG